MQQEKPWASGPGEILQHGLLLLREDSDKNRRLALLSIDNAVELMIKTYLSLPRRVTGLNISRKEYAEISESFPRLLDAIEQHSSEKLSGIDLGEIEWYHRLRNELYHQGNGLTVERNKVEVYAELAKILFKNLFGIEIDTSKNESPIQELMGKFLATWVQVEKRAWEVLDKFRDKSKPREKFSINVFTELINQKIVDSTTAQKINSLRQLRNGVAHGNAEDIKRLSIAHVKSASEILALFENMISTDK
jgi:hypothetical protein